MASSSQPRPRVPKHRGPVDEEFPPGFHTPPYRTTNAFDHNPPQVPPFTLDPPTRGTSAPPCFNLDPLSPQPSLPLQQHAQQHAYCQPPPPYANMQPPPPYANIHPPSHFYLQYPPNFASSYPNPFSVAGQAHLTTSSNHLVTVPPDPGSEGPLAASLYKVVFPIQSDISNLGSFGTPLSRYSDPNVFVTSFHERLRLMGYVDAVMCRLFPTCLEGAAWDWYTTLPSGSIHSFDPLIKSFLARFGSIRKPRYYL